MRRFPAIIFCLGDCFMQQIKSTVTKAKSYLKTHKKIRIALIVLLALMLLTAVLHPKGRKTFLVMGMDNYGSLNEIGRNDVTMLVQVDFTRAKIDAVTFARDMFIENERGSLNKINTIVRSNDEETLVKRLEDNFGLEIDGWFRVNFSSVFQLVDAIGGVEIELTQQEANYVDKTAGKYPENPLSEGLCHLNGPQALTYARCRKLDNDLGRGQRQGKLMKAMVAQTKHLTVSRIVNVYNSLKHAWRSSLSAAQQASLLAKAVWLRGADVDHIAMPFEGHWRFGEAYGTSGVVADLPANRALLREALGLPAEKTEATGN